MQTLQQGVGSPTGHTLNWECPTLLEATPGAHHRGCLARKVLMPQETSGSAKSSCALPHCFKFFEFFFLRHWFSSLSCRSLLVILAAGCLTSRKPVWDQCASLLGNPATHPQMVLLLPWQVEHPGSLPWAGWARTPCSCNFLLTPTLINKSELVEMSYSAGYYDWLL